MFASGKKVEEDYGDAQCNGCIFWRGAGNHPLVKPNLEASKSASCHRCTTNAPTLRMRAIVEQQGGFSVLSLRWVRVNKALFWHRPPTHSAA